jgi:hypothetical protein
VAKRERSGSGLGGFLGIVVFLGGIALLLYTFKMAYDLFLIPPEDAIKLQRDKALDLNTAGQSLMGILLKVLVLIVMGIIGSLIANRGVSLFSGSKSATHHPEPGPDAG